MKEHQKQISMSLSNFRLKRTVVNTEVEDVQDVEQSVSHAEGWQTQGRRSPQRTSPAMSYSDMAAKASTSGALTHRDSVTEPRKAGLNPEFKHLHTHMRNSAQKMKVLSETSLILRSAL